MDIKGLDLTEISCRLEKYVTCHFKDFILLEGQCLFAESYLFYFDEVKHLIPDKYHHRFKDTKFNGASGLLEGGSMSDESEFILMMLTDEEYSKALFLLIQEENDLSDKERVTMLADLLE